VHVLITADTLGGVWTYTRELVCGLLGRGHQVTLVSFGRRPTPAQSFWLSQPHFHHYPTDFPLEWMQHAQQGVTESVSYLQEIIYECQPDLLHFSQFCYGALKSDIPKIVVAHSDVLSWWHAVYGSEPPESHWLQWYRNQVSAGLEGADVVVAPSQWMLDTIGEHYGRFPNSRVIHNGRNPEIFRPAEHKTEGVLSVGRLWDEGKQVSLLLARNHPVPIKIVGSLEHPEGIRSHYPVQIQDSGRWTFCGEQDEIQLSELYAVSAAYAATSRYEPFGLAPVEAALSQCALIANDIPVFQELWQDAAFYFRRNDPDDLASAIAALTADTGLRADYSQRAYARARSCFTAKMMLAEYDDLYRTLAGARADA